MKRKTIILLAVCVLLALFVLGITGVLRMGNEAADGETEQDCLIGMLVTREPLDLFDYEGYFSENADKLLAGGEISREDSAAYQGGLYANPVEQEAGSERYTEYVFNNVEGYALYSAFSGSGENGINYTSGDEAISDSKTHLSYTDGGKCIELEGTIYVTTENGPKAFYFNPVYQAATGELYALAGQGTSFSGDLSEGMSHSTCMKEEQEYSADTASETESVASEIKLTVTYILPPEKLVLIQFDGQNNIISQEEYAPGRLPEKLKPEPGTEYIVLASVNSQGTERELFQRDDEYLEAFFCREDGICVKTSTELIWS